MSLEACVSATADELGISKDDAAEIAAGLVKERARLAAAGPDGIEDKLRTFAKGKAEEARIAAALKRKQAALNVLARDSLDKHLDSQVKKGVRLDEAIVSFLLGGVYNRDSISAVRGAYEAKWIGGLHDRIAREVPVALEMVKKRDAEARPFFDDVVREMAELKKDGTPGSTKNKDAQKLAGLLAGHGEAMRLELNRLGANIGRLDGWTGPQRWNARLLLKAGGTPKEAAEAWVVKVLPLLDLERSFGAGTDEAKAAGILRGVWHNIVTGQDLRVSPAEKGEHLGPANLARSMEKHRVLHFKDADGWLAANAEFGRGHVLDGITDMMHSSARKASLMRKLGPNPEVMLRSVLEERSRGLSKLSREGGIDPQAAGDLIGTLGLGVGTRIGRAYDIVSGSANVPGNITFATIARIVRAVVTMAKLGGSFLSQFPDLGTYAASMRFQGKGLGQSHLDALTALLKGADPAAARLLQVGSDAFRGDVHARFNVDGLAPGLMSKAIETFYKLSGVKWWSERLETAFATMTSAHMADQTARAFDELSPQYRHVLGLHGLDAKGWEAVRGAVEEIGGHRYVVPEKVADEATGMRVRQFFMEEAAYGVVKGDDRTRLVMTQGGRPGTPLGEMFRTLLQFSSFSVAYGQKTLGRELYGYRGATPVSGFKASALQVGKSAGQNLPALAHLIVATTALGMLSMWAKDIAKNRTPKDPTRRATWLAALAQGGGLGIYGDFLFGQRDRMGGTLQSKIAGPAMGTVGDALDLLMKARDASLSDKEKVHLSDWLNFGINNTPYVNLFYLRPALDLAILNGLQEWASPGTSARREGSLKQQFGQRYIVSPLGHSLLARHHASPRGALE